MNDPTDTPTRLRYRETGKLHMDFHRTINGTIGYLRKNFGREVLDAGFRRTAHDVYRAIWDELKAGDTRQLVEHWRYFFGREGGEFEITEDGDEIRLTVSRCPAIAYLQREGIAIDPDFCRQTIVVNAALAEETPFEITTEVLGNGRCVQTIRRRHDSE